MKPVHIVLADDHAIVRHGLKALLEAHTPWHVDAQAIDGWDVVAKAKALQPDIVILDISMPGLNGLDAAVLIKKEAPEARVLMLTVHDSEELIEKCLRAGAMGYVLKSDAERDLIAAVGALSEGRTFFTTAAGKVILRRFQRSAGKFRKEPLQSLTSRERQVVQLLAEGKSNKEMANLLNLSVRTVESHRAKIMQKLNIQSLGELVRYAVRNNLVQP